MAIIRLENIPPVIRRKDIERVLIKLCYDNDISFMAIFGSYARDEQKRGSDLDIAIKYSNLKNKSLFDFIDLEYKLSKIFRRKVDLSTYDSLYPLIKNEVVKEMKVIYEN